MAIIQMFSWVCPFCTMILRNMELVKKFIPINDLIDKHTEKLKDIIDSNPDIVKMISASDKNIYSVPSLEEYYPSVYGSKVWINTRWLDELNLEMPRNTDEFYNTLLAFRNNDPNGNNTMDEIPFILPSHPQ